MLELPTKRIEYRTSASLGELTALIEKEINSNLTEKEKALTGKEISKGTYKIVEKSYLGIAPVFVTFIFLRVCLIRTNASEDKAHITLQLVGGSRFKINLAILYLVFIAYLAVSIFYLGFSGTYIWGILIAVFAGITGVARFASGYSIEYNFLELLKENGVKFKKVHS